MCLAKKQPQMFRYNEINKPFFLPILLRKANELRAHLDVWPSSCNVANMQDTSSTTFTYDKSTTYPHSFIDDMGAVGYRVTACQSRTLTNWWSRLIRSYRLKTVRGCDAIVSKEMIVDRIDVVNRKCRRPRRRPELVARSTSLISSTT